MTDFINKSFTGLRKLNGGELDCHEGWGWWSRNIMVSQRRPFQNGWMISQLLRYSEADLLSSGYMNTDGDDDI